MDEGYLQHARSLELNTLGTNNLGDLRERSPELFLHRRNNDKMSFEQTNEYLCLHKIYKYVLDLVNAQIISKQSDSFRTTLDSKCRDAFLEIANGEMEKVGLIGAHKFEETYSSITRGFVRILYQEKPNGNIKEGYILCDVHNNTSSRINEDSFFIPTNYEVDVFELLSKGYYL